MSSAPKFVAEGLYPGAPTEDARRSGENAVNAMLDRLMAGLPRTPDKTFVLSEFALMLRSFEQSDTEEREMACNYCDQVMQSLGIESSDGLLNNWRYGFDPM